MTDYSAHIPPSIGGKQDLVHAAHGRPVTFASTRNSLKKRGLIGEDGLPTELGYHVAHLIEVDWAANRERLG
ncbi:hypothetical protein ACT3SZ_15575 [Corynebacterium sp. AOP40-9SA-29]|uniref:hypothetical protein n=1 Tax=Corynebacterium sp. AOP40-9SA-29 TaxID=3457677 RepID=UPI0040334B11